MVAITALNGRIPQAVLAAVPGGHLLRMDAAASLARLSAAMDAAGHGPLLLSPGRSGYRTLADQRYMISIGLTTMPAGQSQHGEGLAADLAGLGGYDGTRYRWLAEHGPAYGWTQPAWARRGGSLPEPWHWEYDPRTDQHPTAQEDDDMALTPEQDNLLRHLVAMVGEVPGRTATAVANVPVSRVAGKPSTWLQDSADTGTLVRRLLTVLDPDGDGALNLPRVDVDEAAIAAALAPLLTPATVAALSDADLARIADAVVDEQHNRLAG